MQTEEEIKDRVSLLKQSREKFIAQVNQELAGFDARIYELEIVLNPALLNEVKKDEESIVSNTG